MSSLSKINRVLEIFWWSMTAVTLILVVILSLMYGFDKWGFYFVIPFFTALMALVRRFMSRRLEKSEAFKAKNSKKK